MADIGWTSSMSIIPDLLKLALHPHSRPLFLKPR